jgi:hypothetical protein
MDVEDVWLLGAEDARHPPPEQAVRDQPEVAAASPGKATGAHHEARDADLVKALLQLDHLLAWCDPGETAVPVMRDRWEHRRVVREPELLEDRNRPVRDGEAGCPVATDGGAAEVLEQFLAAPHVFPELLLGELVYELVPVSVTGDLVAGGSDPPHQGGTVLRHPAQHEERAAHLPIAQQLEHAIRIALDAELAPTPAIPRNGPLEVLIVEPVLHVDRHGGRV